MDQPCRGPRAKARRINRSSVPCGSSMCSGMGAPLVLLQESRRRGAPEVSAATKLTVSDHQDVAVLDDVLFPLELEQPLLAHPGVSAEIGERFPVHHFGTDEFL